MDSIHIKRSKLDINISCASAYEIHKEDTMNTNLLSAGTITKDPVKNMKGEDIGKIHELMLDPTNGHIEYAVLSFGGFMGMGDKYFAIPWQALELDTTNKGFRLDITKEKLEESEGFDKDNWPNFADDTFLHQVNTRYHGIGNFSYRPQ